MVIKSGSLWELALEGNGSLLQGWFYALAGALELVNHVCALCKNSPNCMLITVFFPGCL